MYHSSVGVAARIMWDEFGFVRLVEYSCDVVHSGASGVRLLRLMEGLDVD